VEWDVVQHKQHYTLDVFILGREGGNGN